MTEILSDIAATVWNAAGEEALYGVGKIVIPANELEAIYTADGPYQFPA